MLRTYIFLILLFAAILAKAQPVPGYLGKRLSVGYKLHTFISLANPTSATTIEPIDENGDQTVKANFIFHGQHYLNAEYAISKKHSLAADLLFTNLYLDPIYAYGNNALYNYNYSNDFYAGYNEFGKASAIGLMLGTKFYKEHYAPLGSYFQLKLGAVSLNVQDFSYDLYSQNKLANNKPPYTPDSSYTVTGGNSLVPVLAVGWGVIRVIKDCILIDFGFEIGVTYKGWGERVTIFSDGESSDFYPLNGNSTQNQEELIKIAEGRFLTQNILNFRLGISYLL